MTKFIMVVGTVLVMRAAANVSGVWNLDMQWAGRETHSTGVCTLKQDGETLTGSCADAHSTITGEAKGQILTWRIDVEQEGQKGQMSFEGKLNDAGTTITGKCTMAGGREGTFTMTKQ